MRTRTRITALALTALALAPLVGGCGGSGGTSKASSTTDSSKATSQTDNASSDATDTVGGNAKEANEIVAPVACMLLTPQQISALTGGDIQDGHDRGTPTSCVWRRPPSGGQIGDQVVLIEERTSDVENGKVVESARIKYEDKRDTNEGTDISGVGDAAFVIDHGNEVLVYTVKGDVLMWLILGEQLTDLGLPGKPVDVATALAKQALTKVP